MKKIILGTAFGLFLSTAAQAECVNLGIKREVNSNGTSLTSFEDQIEIDIFGELEKAASPLAQAAQRFVKARQPTGWTALEAWIESRKIVETYLEASQKNNVLTGMRKFLYYPSYISSQGNDFVMFSPYLIHVDVTYSFDTSAETPQVKKSFVYRELCSLN